MASGAVGAPKAGSLYHYFESREKSIRQIMIRGITKTHVLRLLMVGELAWPGPDGPS